MVKNRYSSPIIISDEDIDSSSTESDSTIESDPTIELNPDYWGPENQLGLESRELSRYRQDNGEVALDEKGEVKHHEAIVTH